MEILKVLKINIYIFFYKMGSINSRIDEDDICVLIKLINGGDEYEYKLLNVI
jgi:hypothetical protein